MKCCEISIGIIYTRLHDIAGTIFRIENFRTLKRKSDRCTWKNSETIANYLSESCIFEVDASGPRSSTSLEGGGRSTSRKSKSVFLECGITTTNANIDRHIPIRDDAAVLSLDRKINRYLLAYFQSGTIWYIKSYMSIGEYWSGKCSDDFLGIF